MFYSNSYYNCTTFNNDVMNKELYVQVSFIFQTCLQICPNYADCGSCLVDYYIDIQEQTEIVSGTKEAVCPFLPVLKFCSILVHRASLPPCGS